MTETSFAVVFPTKIQGVEATALVERVGDSVAVTVEPGRYETAEALRAHLRDGNPIPCPMELTIPAADICRLVGAIKAAKCPRF